MEDKIFISNQLYLQQVREEGMLIFLMSALSLQLHNSSVTSSLIVLLSLFSLSLGDDTEWPTRVDVSLNKKCNKK